jgi:hypothetical protein
MKNLCQSLGFPLLIQPRKSPLHILKANIGVHVSCPTTVFCYNKKAPALSLFEDTAQGLLRKIGIIYYKPSQAVKEGPQASFLTALFPKSILIRLCLDRLWSYRPVVDANVINQAGEEGDCIKVFSSAKVQATILLSTPRISCLIRSRCNLQDHHPTAVTVKLQTSPLCIVVPLASTSSIRQ